MNAQNEPQASEKDQILILTAEHGTRSLPVYKAGMTIGSKPDNDIVLDDPRVGEYHARIDREDGRYRIIDLNSTTGTFLGDQRLHPGVPVEWTEDKNIRIGENWLGLRIGGGVDPDEVTQPVLERVDPNLIRWSIGQQIGVYVFTEQLTLAPGNRGSVSIVLFNQGPSERRLNLELSGVPPNWVGAMPAMISVPAQGEQPVELVISLPDAPPARFGRHVITIRVSDQEMPVEQVEFSLALTVPATSRYLARLITDPDDPKKLAQLIIENRGNIPETFTITIHDPSGRLSIELSAVQVKLEPGETTRVDLRVTPPFDLFAVHGREYPFTIHVRSSAGREQAIESSLLNQGFIPVWLVPVLIAGFLMVCAGIVWATGGGFGPTPTPTWTTNVGLIDTDGDTISDVDEIVLGTDPMLVDTDGDGLNDKEEQQYGTDPLVVDTDGDTLPDGQEVRELNISPVNPDTDGDGINDNLDPEPGHLPTFTPAPPSVTPLPPTPIPAQPTATPTPPTATALPPTDTLIPPTLTQAPPTGTSVPPTATQVPPTETQVPPTITSTPIPMIVSGWIAFESQRDGNLEIYTYHGEAQSEWRLTDHGSDDQHLVWDSAGDRMTFDSDREGSSDIYTMNRDGSEQTRLTDNPAQDTHPAWSPDKSQIAFLSDRDGNVEIYLMSDDGFDETRLTDTPADECCLAWSPLGNMIAFISNLDGTWRLYRVNPDGSDLRALAAANPLPFTWSSDGARLAFTTDRDGNAEIYAINNDGTGESRLTNNSAQDTNPVWSPNGSLIVFLSNRDGNYEIYVMNPDGSNQTRLTNTGGNECCLVWSPDGSQLAFASDFEGNSEIYVLDINSLSMVRLTSNPAYDSPVAWRP